MAVEALHSVVAVWPHEGHGAELVRELKYGRATAVVTELAEAMAAVAPPADLITWAPASPDRRRRRGFDQCELLARGIARRVGVPARPMLRRLDHTPQTARDGPGRRSGPELSGRGRRLRFAPRVLLVDDVTTTGATLRAAATVLHDRGAGEITGLVATRVCGQPDGALVTRSIYDRGTPPTGGQEWTSPSVHGMSKSRRGWRK